jgi:hypothetical protein
MDKYIDFWNLMTYDYSGKKTFSDIFSWQLAHTGNEQVPGIPLLVMMPMYSLPPLTQALRHSTQIKPYPTTFLKE